MKWHSRPFCMREFKVEVTYRCDMNCVHCSSDAHPSNPLEMSQEDCLSILKQAGEMGAERVAFSGGEPFLWPHLLSAIGSAASCGLAVSIYTSGNIVGFSDLAEAAQRVGASKLVFSLFGANALAHERVTRKAGSFDRTVRSMRDAVSLHLDVEAHFVPMASNYRELPDIAALAHKVGASRISILRLVPQGRAALIRGRILDRVQNLELRRTVQAARKTYGAAFVRTGSPYNFLLLNDKPGCWAAIDRLIIGPDQQVYPCDAFKRISSAELVKTDFLSRLDKWGLRECWEGSPYLEAVRDYLTTDFAEPCASCRLLERCVSGCLAQKVIANGALQKCPDPDCLGPNFQGDTR